MTSRYANHLVVFARMPAAGRVKRRLARDIGEVAALRFYRQTATDLLRRLGRDPRWRCWLAVTPDGAARMNGIWPPGWRVMPQGRGDLGDRMARPFVTLPPGPVVLIGSDTPQVRAAHIAAAFDALRRCDLVFGPAVDGGYWLVGARRRVRVPGLFRNVRWSTSHALGDTLANLGPGLRVGFLAELEDVDDGESYRRGLLRKGAGPAP